METTRNIKINGSHYNVCCNDFDLGAIYIGIVVASHIQEELGLEFMPRPTVSTFKNNTIDWRSDRYNDTVKLEKNLDDRYKDMSTIIKDVLNHIKVDNFNRSEREITVTIFDEIGEEVASHIATYNGDKLSRVYDMCDKVMRRCPDFRRRDWDD